MGLFGTQLLHNETLYSWVARWGILSGYPDHRSAVSSFLGSDNRQLHSMFPSYISQLSSVLSLRPEGLLEQHTILPYFRAFKSAHNYENIKNHILNGRTRAIHSKLSLIANRLPQDGYLKFCYMCSSEDYMKNGYTFWHVEHQLPFISVCFKHKFNLQHINVSRRELLIPPTIPTQNAELQSADAKAIQLTQLTIDLFNLKNPFLDATKVRACYLERLKEKTLATQSKSIRMSSLRSELKLYWAQALDTHNGSVLNSLVHSEKAFEYPASLFYQPNCHHHPIKHLLLIGMLFGDWKSFIRAYECTDINTQTKLESAHPMPKPRNNEVEIISMIKRGTSMRQASILTQTSIGYIKRVAMANRLDVDTRPQKIFIPEKAFIITLAEKGMRAIDIAERLGCCTGAVEQIISQTEGLVDTRKTLRFLKLRTRHRSMMNNAIKNYSRRIDIQKAMRSSYSWLYKNDKEWLYKNLPPAVPRSRRYLAEP